MKLSIITPSFNQGSVIGETLHSVLGQKGDFDLEYLVFDGGSTDQTVDELKRFELLLKQGVYSDTGTRIEFSWVSEPDRGQSHAINKGMSQATGDVIAWINSDDVYFPGALQCMVKEFSTRFDVDVIYGDGDVIDEDGERAWWWRSKPHSVEDHRHYCFLWNDFLNHILQPSCFWRRSVVERIGTLDESFHFAMDVEYWLRMGRARCRFRHVRRPIARFRMIEGTKSLSSPTVFWPDFVEIYRRYNGARSLEAIYAFYLFNEFLHGEITPATMDLALARIEERLSHCSESERTILGGMARAGKGRSCYLIASHLFLADEGDRARDFLDVGRTLRPDLSFSRIGLWCSLCDVLGARVMRRLDHVRERLVNVFRRAFQRGNGLAEFLLRSMRYGL